MERRSRARGRLKDLPKDTVAYEYKMTLKLFQIRLNVLSYNDMVKIRRLFSYSVKIPPLASIALIDDYFKMKNDELDAKYVMAKFIANEKTFFNRNGEANLEFNYVILGATKASPLLVLLNLLKKRFNITEPEALTESQIDAQLKQAKLILERGL